MIPGPDEIIACPRCGGLAKRPTLISGNTFGAIFWTDGKMLAPMLPHLPAITRCAQCQQFYWLDDARVVGELEYGTPVPQAWQQARQIRALTHDEFQAALQADLAQRNENATCAFTIGGVATIRCARQARRAHLNIPLRNARISCASWNCWTRTSLLIA